MLGPDRRFRDPRPEEIAALSLEGMRQAVMSQMHAGNVEVSVVGDLDAAELEACVLKYLGTVSPGVKVPEALPEGEGAGMGVAPGPGRPLQILEGVPLEHRHMTWHLKDSGAALLSAAVAGNGRGMWWFAWACWELLSSPCPDLLQPACSSPRWLTHLPACPPACPPSLTVPLRRRARLRLHRRCCAQPLG